VYHESTQRNLEKADDEKCPIKTKLAEGGHNYMLLHKGYTDILVKWNMDIPLNKVSHKKTH